MSQTLSPQLASRVDDEETDEREYTIDELDDDAREHVLEKLREINNSFVNQDVTESISCPADELGIDAKNIYWNVGWGHEYAVIDFGRHGEVDFEQLVCEVGDDAPPFRKSDLYTEARAALAYARANQYEVSVRYNLHRSGYGHRTIEVEINEASYDMLLRHELARGAIEKRVEAAVVALFEGLETELLNSIRCEYEYYTSDEYLLERARDQGRRYDRDGNRIP